ncbi:MAG: KxYKxGKxW signal peptide domain-containing protein, partial [Lactobacillaceae bacterium]|nr:KxYKxGKxW signal peptide domain-containing protein [Lactobacillaceae bacterium]
MRVKLYKDGKNWVAGAIAIAASLVLFTVNASADTTTQINTNTATKQVVNDASSSESATDTVTSEASNIVSDASLAQSTYTQEVPTSEDTQTTQESQTSVQTTNAEVTSTSQQVTLSSNAGKTISVNEPKTIYISVKDTDYKNVQVTSTSSNFSISKPLYDAVNQQYSVVITGLNSSNGVSDQIQVRAYKTTDYSPSNTDFISTNFYQQVTKNTEVSKLISNTSSIAIENGSQNISLVLQEKQANNFNHSLSINPDKLSNIISNDESVVKATKNTDGTIKLTPVSLGTTSVSYTYVDEYGNRIDGKLPITVNSLDFFKNIQSATYNVKNANTSTINYMLEGSTKQINFSYLEGNSRTYGHTADEIRSYKDSGYQVTFKSTNPSFTVSEDGLITAVGPIDELTSTANIQIVLYDPATKTTRTQFVIVAVASVNNRVDSLDTKTINDVSGIKNTDIL